MENTFFLKERDMFTKILLRTVLLFTVIFFYTSAFGATFKGKVIDADTRQPIEGAVVVASWLEETATISGPSTRPKDIREALTDKNGEWIIQGVRGREGGTITSIFTFLTRTYYTRPPEFVVFKPGYCSWPTGFGIDTCKEKIKPGRGNKVEEGETVELPILTIRDRETLLRNIPFIAADGYKKLPIFEKLLDKDIEKSGR
jgi:hypothetical protein